MSKKDYFPKPEINHYGAGIYDDEEKYVSHTSASGIWTPKSDDGGKFCPVCKEIDGKFQWMNDTCWICFHKNRGGDSNDTELRR